MKTIYGIGLLSAGLLLSACDSPVEPTHGASIPDDAPAVDLPAGETGDAPANPFAGATLYVDSWHPANATVSAWRDDRP